jgi:DNA repair ATPase RecN
MTLELETLVAPVISVIVSVVVAWVAWSSRLAVLETKLDDLADDVRKHNNLVERMARLEISDKAQWERLDERRDECHEMQREVNAIKNEMAQYHH